MGDILDIVGGYEVTENEEVEIHEGDIFFILCSRKRIWRFTGTSMYFGTKNLWVASESAMKVLLILLTRVKGVIITAF